MEPYTEDILHMYAEHGNGGKIAKDLGITNYRVYKCLRENGVEPKKRGGKEKHSVQKMIQMYTSGLSTIEIADQLCMHESSVWERLSNSGVILRARGYQNKKLTADQEQDLVRRYEAGEHSGPLGKEYGIHKSSVTAIVKRHGGKIKDNYGPNNPSWKGGRVPLDKLVRNHSKYAKLRERLFQESNYTCALCHCRGVRLEMHHIQPFREIMDDFVSILSTGMKYSEINSRIEKFHAFWDEDNLMVLCDACHKEEHVNFQDDD